MIDPTVPAPWSRLRTASPLTRWPRVPGYPGALALAVQHQLAASQWWTPQALEAAQTEQLAALLEHARCHVPFYRERLAPLAGVKPTPARFRQVPLLGRREVQDAGKRLSSEAVPADHGEVLTHRTTGSATHPLEVHGTRMTAFLANATVLRDHLWHARDFSAPLAVIQASVEEKDVDGWGSATDPAFETGRCSVLDVRRSVAEQVRWLAERRPRYLLTYVTNAHALASHCLSNGIRIAGLEEVRTLGEVMRPDLEALARAAWGAKVVDAYSATEVGTVALQCPEAGAYHVQSETLLVEILDRAGEPCPVGEPGRVVITTLHNFAMPLIRYEIQDYAVPGPPCRCGRGLPVLERIMGRARNMVELPDGSRHWPSFPAGVWLPVPAVRQVQLVQHRPDRIEVRLVADRELRAAEIEGLTERLVERLGHPFELEWRYVDRIERAGGYKLEDFVSRL